MATKTGNKKKILIVGGILALGVGGYFWWKHKQSSSASLPASSTGSGSTPTTGTSTTIISATPAPPPAPASSAVANMQQTLLQWSTGSQNPSLYASWIRNLTDQQTAAMYDIVTNYWSGKAPETPAQESAWNALVSQYPFLRTGGLKSNGQPCNDFNCAT